MRYSHIIPGRTDAFEDAGFSCSLEHPDLCDPIRQQRVQEEREAAVIQETYDDYQYTNGGW